MENLFTKPTVSSNVLDVLRERDISPTTFVNTVEAFGGSRRAAYNLTKGRVSMHATTMLVIAYVLSKPVGELFFLEFGGESVQGVSQNGQSTNSE